MFIYEAYDYAGQSTMKSTGEIIVDVTPPSVGHIIFNDIMMTSRYVSSDFTIHVSGFHDYESGIEYFEVAFGKQPEVADVQRPKKYYTETIDVYLEDISAQDGFIYYIMVKVSYTWINCHC